VLVHGSLVGLLLYRDWLNASRYRPQTISDEKVDFHALSLIERPLPKKESRDNPDGPEQEVDNPPAARFNSSNATRAKQTEVPNKPPVAPLLPQQGNDTVGPGRPMPSNVAGPADGVVAPSGILDGAPAAPRSLGNGDATFFTIGDKGKRVIYVVDRSGSMIHNDALLVAKQQLIASLNGLTSKHRFQIIFYDEAAHLLSLGEGNPQDMIAATSRNIEKIKRRIAAVQPKGGTRHMAALRPALQRRPDVIFFLTDADDGLTAGEMNEIRNLNKAKTRIHCIEFGKGPRTPGEFDFLQRLAAMTGGKYTYRDVQKFQRR
jgi:Ca-activated chloride channel family protein